MKLKTFFITILHLASLAVFSQNITDKPESFTEQWKFKSQRSEIAPIHSNNDRGIFKEEPALTLSGGGKEYAIGCWFTIRDVNPGHFYKFQVYYKAEKIEEPWRSVYASIIWIGDEGEKIGTTEFPKTLYKRTTEGLNIIEQSYQIPDKAKKAQLELGYRWDADGTVHFGNFSFTEIQKPLPRKVKLATVFHRPANSKNSQENLNQFAGFIEEAGKKQADIVCFPEAMTLIGTSHNYISAAEPIPGPSTVFLGEAAKKHNLYIVAGLLEKEGDVIYNTAVLINRAGEIEGKYRKVSLPREEIEGGITPGKDLPVFDTDFGRIGIIICWDLQFPEIARTLAMKGAEVIFVPIWGGNLTLAKARTIENQVYLVTSSYDMVSAIFNLKGEIISEAKKTAPMVISEVDLTAPIYWEWTGDLKSRIYRELPTRSSLTW